MTADRFEPATHLFQVGQTVRFKSRSDRPPHSAESFLVTRTLPPSAGSLQYRIRNEAERYERVATEDRLELVLPSHGSEQDTLERQVFGKG